MTGKIEPPYEIEVRAFKFKNETLGITEYEDLGNKRKFIITIDKSLNRCWRRMVILKELCQIYYDYEKGAEFYSKNELDKQIIDLVSKHKYLIETPEMFSLKITDKNFSEVPRPVYSEKKNCRQQFTPQPL